MAVDRSQVRVRAEAGQRPWPTVEKLLSELSFHLSAAQVGITISTLVFGAMVAPLGAALVAPIIQMFIPDFSNIALTGTITVALATALQVVMGEVVPKTLGIAEPLPVLRVLAPAIKWWGWIVRPVVSVVNNMADSIVARLGMEPSEELGGFQSLGELESVIRASGEEGTLDPEDVTRLTRTIRFTEKTAGDILTPRIDVAVLEREHNLADLVKLSAETGYSRFPVIGTDFDDVLGIVDVKAAVGVPPEQRCDVQLSDVMTEPLIVAEDRSLDSLLDEMNTDKHQIAVVIDEQAGVSGIVSIEGIVEEIVGEIDDEYDGENLVEGVTEVREATWVISGGAHPDEVEEGTGLVLPEGRFETLAGYVLEGLQSIPKIGDTYENDGWVFEVVEMDRFRIAQLKVTEPAKPIPDPDDKTRSDTKTAATTASGDSDSNAVIDDATGNTDTVKRSSIGGTVTAITSETLTATTSESATTTNSDSSKEVTP